MSVFLGNQKIDGGYPITTDITSSSTDSEVPSAKAVYDLHQDLSIVDVTSQYSFTPSSNIRVNGWKILRLGGTLYSINLDLSKTSGYYSREEIVGTVTCLPVDPFYGAGRAIYNPGGSNARAYSASGMLLTDGRVRLYYDGTDASATNFQIWFLKADTTRSLNLTKSENTASLVGLGDKSEVSDETLEKTKVDEVTDKDVSEQITEVKEVEPIKEIEESGDKGE